MTRSAVFVSCVGAFCLGLTATASAEPVTITGGALVFTSGDLFQGGSISLTGTRGFSLEGAVASGEGTVPGLGFGFLPGSILVPGSGNLSGNAWVGATATLDGQTFPNVGDAGSLTSFSLNLFVTMMLPELQASPITVTAPFTATGSLFRADPDLPPLEASFQGSGTVAAIFSEAPGGFWDSGGVRYDFTPQVTPEPATLTLMIGGLIARASRMRKRRNQSTDIQLSTSIPTA